MSNIRILLFGLSAMLSEIVSVAVEADPQMRVIPGTQSITELGDYTRQRHIDTVIFSSGNQDFDGETISGLLRVNPRLCLLAVDGRENRATVHFLAPSHTVFSSLEASTIIAAIQAGTRLRLQ